MANTKCNNHSEQQRLWICSSVPFYRSHQHSMLAPNSHSQNSRHAPNLLIRQVMSNWKHDFTAQAWLFLQTASVYAWIAVVVIPVNSAFNPFLYTVTTPRYRETIVKAVARSMRSLNHPTRVGSTGNQLGYTWSIFLSFFRYIKLQYSSPGGPIEQFGHKWHKYWWNIAGEKLSTQFRWECLQGSILS